MMVIAAGHPAVAYGLAFVAVLTALSFAFILLRAQGPGPVIARLPGPVVSAGEPEVPDADDDVVGAPILEPPGEPEAATAVVEVAAPEGPPVAEPTLFERFRSALGRSRTTLSEGVRVWLGKPRDESALEELEEALIMSDVGVTTAADLVQAVRDHASDDADVLRNALVEAMQAKLTHFGP